MFPIYWIVCFVNFMQQVLSISLILKKDNVISDTKTCCYLISIKYLIKQISNCMVPVLWKALGFFYFRYRSLRISSNLLVLNLAITDTFLALGNLPWLAISSFRGYWIFGYIGIYNLLFGRLNIFIIFD